MLIFLGIGLIVGSFLGVLTWRVPRKLDFVKGRSKCPHCGHLIRSYDNIPLISFLLLRGKCRDCHHSISWREPAIEITTALLFFLTPSLNLPFPLPISLVLVSILIVVFVIDLEHKLIYDEFIYSGLALILIYFLLSSSPNIFLGLLVGLTSALFLLLIALATYGRGMGLGDIKLALFLGTMLSPAQSLVWLTSSFLTGAVTGVILIVLQKAKLKTEVPFGPFLIIGFVIATLLKRTLFYANFF